MNSQQERHKIDLSSQRKEKWFGFQSSPKTFQIQRVDSWFMAHWLTSLRYKFIAASLWRWINVFVLYGTSIDDRPQFLSLSVCISDMSRSISRGSSISVCLGYDFADRKKRTTFTLYLSLHIFCIKAGDHNDAFHKQLGTVGTSSHGSVCIVVVLLIISITSSWNGCFFVIRWFNYSWMPEC